MYTLNDGIFYTYPSIYERGPLVHIIREEKLDEVHDLLESHLLSCKEKYKKETLL